MGLGSWLLHQQIEGEAVKEFKQTDISFFHCGFASLFFSSQFALASTENVKHHANAAQYLALFSVSAPAIRCAVFIISLFFSAHSLVAALQHRAYT